MDPTTRQSRPAGPRLRRVALVLALLLALPPLGLAAGDPEADLARADELSRQVLALYREGRHAEALPLAREAVALREPHLPPEHPAMVLAVQNVAAQLERLGKEDEALSLYERAVAAGRAGPPSPPLLAAHANLSRLLERMGRGPEAVAAAEGAVAVAEGIHGPQDGRIGPSLARLADLLHDRGEFDRARPLYERLVRLAESSFGPESDQLAISLSNLGLLLCDAGLPREAKPYLERSLAIREKTLGPDHREAARARDNLALCLFHLGDLAGARACLERSLAALERTEGPDSGLVGIALNGIATVKQEMGDAEGALASFQKALPILERAFGAGHPHVATTRGNLSGVLQSLARYGEAEEERLKSLAAMERALGPDHPDLARALTSLGTLLYDVARYEEAAAAHGRALAIHEKASGGDNANVAGVLANLSAVRLAQGRHAEAEALAARSVAIRERVLGPGHPDVAIGLNNLAMVYEALGDHEAATALQERALAIQEKAFGPSHEAVAAMLGNLALQRLHQGQATAAEPMAQRCLRIREEVHGPEHPRVGDALNLLALVQREQGERAQADDLLERALEIARRAFGAAHPATARALANLGWLRGSQGDWEGARPLQEEALEIVDRVLGTDHPLAATAAGHLAETLQALGDLRGARALRERALRSLEGLLGSEHPATGTALGNLGIQDALEGRYPAALEALRRAVAVQEKAARRALPALHGPERIARVRSVRPPLEALLRWSERLGVTGYAEVLRVKGLVARAEAAERRLMRQAPDETSKHVQDLHAAQRTVAALANKVPSARLPEERARWKQSYARAVEEEERQSLTLAAKFAPLREGLERLDLGVTDLRARLGPDEVLVDFLRANGRYYAWVLRWKGTETRVDLGPAAALEEAAEALALAARSEDDEAAVRAAGVTLGTLLWKPLAPHVPPGTGTIHVVPDAGLAAVPFGLVAPADDGRFVLEDRRLVWHAAAQDLVPVPGARADDGRSVVVAAVDYGRARGPAAPTSFAPLPDTDGEAEVLRARLGTHAVLLRGSAATEAALRAAVPRARYVHLATHGYVREELLRRLARPLEDAVGQGALGLSGILVAAQDPLLACGLALAGANGEDGAGGDDGILTAAEACGLDLDSCEMVVLSACDSARGTPEAGEGVLGLVQAFQLAGARSVVASLWPVDDEATRLLMERFYGGVLRAERPLPPSAALREAALWLRSQRGRSGRSFAAPRYWAGFVTYGR